jgi:hypothetical protein
MVETYKISIPAFICLTLGTGVLHLIRTNHQPDATIFQFIILKFVYSSTCFGRFPAHDQELNDCSGSLWFYLRIVLTVVLCSWSGRPARPRTQHGLCQHRSSMVESSDISRVIFSMEPNWLPQEEPLRWVSYV